MVSSRSQCKSATTTPDLAGFISNFCFLAYFLNLLHFLFTFTLNTIVSRPFLTQTLSCYHFTSYDLWRVQ